MKKIVKKTQIFMRHCMSRVRNVHHILFVSACESNWQYIYKKIWLANFPKFMKVSINEEKKDVIVKIQWKSILRFYEYFWKKIEISEKSRAFIDFVINEYSVRWNVALWIYENISVYSSILCVWVGGGDKSSFLLSL